jgi:sugar phosphate isomerase/epimerase
MKTLRHLSRRNALKITAITAFGAPLLASTRAFADDLQVKPGKELLKLGVASISLSKLPPAQVVAALKELQIHYVSLFRTHCNWGGTTDECRAAAKVFTDGGLTITGTGVIDLPNDEAVVHKAFENVRAAGLHQMVCKPALDAYPLVEKFVKEFDIKLAIHNHGPEDKVYPSPYIAWDIIQKYDERIGLCIDVGHCARGGVDPIEAIHKCHARLYDIHMKDSLAEPGSKKDIPAEVGRGKLDIKGILQALVDVKYQHIVAFEYEKKEADPRVGLGESIKFVRTTMAKMSQG